MSSESVTRQQRFHSVDHACPVCEGGQDLQGEERCYGYLSSDGRLAFCPNVEGDLPFNEEADAWPHPTGDDQIAARVNGRPVTENVTVQERVTLAQLAHEKGLPMQAFTSLDCRDTVRGAQIGGKVRGREPKYQWVDGRKPRTDPTFPMPGARIAERIYITAGETDAITLLHAGRDALGITSGEKREKSSLSSGHYRDLMRRGARSVLIVGDGDPHGQEWLYVEAAAARAAGLSVAIVDLAADYDHFGAGIKDLNELWLAHDGNVGTFLAAVDERTREYGQVPVYDLDALRELAETEVSYLVSDLLSPGEKMGLTGPPKSYKSWLALNLAAAVATGGRFLERPEWRVPEPRPVVFVEEEGDAAKFARRIKRAFRDVEHADFFLIPKMGLSLLDRAQVDWVIEQVKQRDAGLLVLDPWQRLIVGVDEDKSKETGPAWNEVHRITLECPRCAVLILHHANKAGGLSLNAIRGSSRFAGEVDLSIIVKVNGPGVLHASVEGRDVPSQVTEEGHLEIAFEAHDPFGMNALGFRVDLSRAGRPSRQPEVLEHLSARPGESFTRTQIAEQTGMAASTVSTHVKALLGGGAIVEVDGRLHVKRETET